MSARNCRHRLLGDRRRRRFIDEWRSRFAELGDAKIEYFDAVTSEPIWLEPDIVGLQSAMDDALLVCFVHRGTHLIENVGPPLERETFLLEQHVAERAAVEILHHEISDFAGFDIRETEVRYVNDIRVA